MSYGDICSFTRSPVVRRIKRLRIFPEICARTRWSLASWTRNIVPARTEIIFPSSSIAFLESMVSCRTGALGRAPVRRIKSAGLAARSRELTRPLFASACFVDGESASLHFLAVEGGDGRVGFRRVRHGDERKAAGAAGGAVHHQGNVGDFAVFFEKILKIVFSGLKREITYVQFHCDFLEQYLPATEPFPRIGFQITTERDSTDDLPRNEQNRT